MSSLHLFVGEEDLLVEEGVRALIDELLPAEVRALNFDTLDAAATPPAEIVLRLNTLPFFGDRRVVLVKDVDALPTEGLRVLEEHLSHGVPPTVAIFTARGIDRRSRLFKAIQQHGTVHPCDPPGWREVPVWVERYAARVRKKLKPPAAQHLVSLVGTDLRTLALEIEKLAAYVGDNPEITGADVEAVASHLAEASVFDLTDAIGARDARKAMAALQSLLQSEHPLPILAMIAGQFRRLARTVAVGARSESALAAAIGVHPYAARKLLALARHYRWRDFPPIFAEIEEADRAIKSTGQPELALETLVARLCSPGVGV